MAQRFCSMECGVDATVSQHCIFEQVVARLLQADVGCSCSRGIGAAGLGRYTCVWRTDSRISLHYGVHGVGAASDARDVERGS